MTSRERAILAAMFCWLGYACATSRTTSTGTLQQGQQHGTASWYGQEFAGRTTANGEIFDPMLMTAAHRSLPFGTVVDVRNAKTNQSVRVRINDRGPYIGNRLIDLSYAAAQQISLIDPGSGDVDITVVKLGQGEREPPAPFSVTIGEQPKEAPHIDIPMPSTPAPAPAPVQETRKQVAPSGRTIETYTVPMPRVTTPVPQPQPQVAKQTPPPAPVPSPAPATAPATSPTGRYIVQAGAYSIEENAKDLQRQLSTIGIQSYIDHTSLYLVRIGPYATREQAVRTRTRLENAGMSAIVIVK
jgi:rare lipoprotein A